MCSLRFDIQFPSQPRKRIHQLPCVHLLTPLVDSESLSTHTHTHTIIAGNQWKLLGFVECDTSAGEVQRNRLFFRSMGGCQDSCEADRVCVSITYFKTSGMCNLYSTTCTNTKSSPESISLRLLAGTQNISDAAQPQIDRISVPYSVCFIVFAFHYLG